MINLNKKNREVSRLLSNNKFSTDITLYFSTRSVGADFDPYEKTYTYTDLNPKTIRGYVRDIKPEALVWKQYGLAEMGAKEIISDDKYAEWFRLCSKLSIGGDYYQVYKENVGNRFLIEKRPMKLIRVIVRKVQ